MRILHLYDEHSKIEKGWGSVVSVILNISKKMVEMGHNVTIIERQWIDCLEQESIDNIEFKRFKIHTGSNIPGRELPYNMISNPIKLIKLLLDRTEFAVKLNEYLKQKKFDIIHAHVPFAINLLVELNKKLENRIVYTLHAGEELKRLGLDSNAPIVLKLFSPDKHIIKKAKVCTVLNQPIKEELIKQGITENKVVVIPNGVNVIEFGNFQEETITKVKQKYNIPEGKTIIMFAGTITPRKGVRNLLKAIDTLVSAGNKNLFLVLTGDNTIDKKYFKECYNFAKQKLSSYVTFLGSIPYSDLKILYSACDVFVLPSYREGDPISLKEALASGKPLIGSNISGIPAQIRNGWNGFLIKPGDYKQLTEKIEYLIKNEYIRKKMGRNSRKLAEELFDWSKITEKYINVYKLITGR